MILKKQLRAWVTLEELGMRATDTEILNVMIDRADINEEC